MLYVFDRGGSAGEGPPNSVPLPPLVREMLQNTDHRPEYYRQVSKAQCTEHIARPSGMHHFIISKVG